MANNPYVNKVVYDGNTLIDITDTTAGAGDVASGKYFYSADGSKTLGTAINDTIIDLNCKTIWTNPDSTQSMGEQQIEMSVDDSFKLIVIQFRLYATSVNAYYVNEVFAPNSDNIAVMSVRYDTSNTNYIIARQARYDFANNRLGVSPGYRQDTYKSYSVTDNNVLIPNKVIGYYSSSSGGDTLNDLKVLVVTSSNFSSLPQTINNNGITSNHVVVNSVLSNPSAQTGDWDVTTSDGSLNISGTIDGTTNVTLYLLEER